MNGVNWWRMYRPLGLLTQQHRDIDIRWNRGQILPSDLLWADVALAFRPCNAAQVGVLQAAKQSGCRIVLDYDDDLLNIPIEHGAYASLSGAAPYVRAALALADVVWVSTPELGQALGHPKSFVVPNAILESDLPAGPNKMIYAAAWRGSVMGFYDLWDKEAEYQDMARGSKYFDWIGYKPPYKSIKSCETKFHPWDHNAAGHFTRLKSLGLNVLWKPLSPTKFNDSKSNIAWIEATVAGGVCLTDATRQKKQHTWACCLSEMTYNEDLIKKTWRDSVDMIRLCYLLDRANNIRRESLEFSNAC